MIVAFDSEGSVRFGGGIGILAYLGPVDRGGPMQFVMWNSSTIQFGKMCLLRALTGLFIGASLSVVMKRIEVLRRKQPRDLLS